MQRLASLGVQLRTSLTTTGFSPFAQSLALNKSPLSAWGVPCRNFGVMKKKQITFPKWKIVRGDRVGIISGKDKGKQGTVLKVYRKLNKVIVSGINQKIKRVRADFEKDQKGGVKAKLHPVHISNVMLIDPESGKPTKVRFGYLSTGDKVRISKSSGSIIAKTMLPVYDPKIRNKNKIDGLKDTSAAKAMEITYHGEDFDKIKEEFEAFIQEKERKEKLLVFRD